ncbi:MAG TPA: 3-dehydroquinate synthase [Spirochaetales bacterium]|nr:3-dehydroquinate synthase [Spirochaetales bacterium]
MNNGLESAKPEKGDSEDSAIVFCGLKDLAKKLAGKNVVVLTDGLINALYGSMLPKNSELAQDMRSAGDYKSESHNAVQGEFPEASLVIVPQGEKAKSLETLKTVYAALKESKVDRTWALLAVGGGTVSDLAGFVASTWMRGIEFFVAPTTLLSMVDAALGGKNGLNFDGAKNLIGTFLLPKAVFCDIETLRSLPAVQFASGMAEVIKHAIIDGEENFSFLEQSVAAWKDPQGFDFRRCPYGILERIVAESQRVKLGFVKRDFKERNVRKTLNLGHTFGHAIEASLHLPHGHSVACGILLACEFSFSKGFMEYAQIERISKLLGECGLPDRIEQEKWPQIRQACTDLVLMDKKRRGDQISFVMPRAIGNVTLEDIPLHELYAFLEDASWI